MLFLKIIRGYFSTFSSFEEQKKEGKIRKKVRKRRSEKVP
jgi:hypothetical protein